MTENESVFEFSVGNDVTDERYSLAIERVTEISDEHIENKEFDDYFHTVREFILMVDETYKWSENGGKDKDSLEELQARNKKLYSDILPENYDTSYGNPTYACTRQWPTSWQQRSWTHTTSRVAPSSARKTCTAWLKPTGHLHISGFNISGIALR